MRKRKISLLDKFYLEDANGAEFLQLNRKFSLGRMKFTIVFNNTAGDGAPVELDLKGSFFDRHADITLNGIMVARITKNITMGSLLIDKDRYQMELAPGCDVVLFAAIVVCLDEAHRDEQR